jgi:hypothetical protein
LDRKDSSRVEREIKKIKAPPPFSSPTGRRGKKEDEKNLTAPLTFVLSRKGREEMKGKIFQRALTLPLSRRWRGKKEEEKNLTAPLTFVLSRKGREREKREIHLIKSILFVFVNLGVFNV